ncbi:MAG: hypothetical protein ACKVS5_04045 [Parvularculaceae bacterium]
MALTATKFFLDPARQSSAQDEARFFRSLKVRNRNSKQTGRGRLDALNVTAIELLTAPGRRLNGALDIGISSGVTTAELFDSFKNAGLSPALTATDLSIYASIVDVAPNVRVLIDSAGDVLQYDIGGLAVRPWRRRLDQFTGMAFVKSAIETRYADAARKAVASGTAAARRIALINPRLASNPAITVVEDDLLKANPAFAGRFDFIRAANVLNREYFDEATIKGALATLKSYLSGPGAILLIVRTNDNTGHHGAFYELDAGNRLRAIRTIGEGSELAPLIDAGIGAGAP